MRKETPIKQRKVTVVARPTGNSPGLVRVAEGKVIDEYEYAEVPSDFERAFVVRKVKGKVNEKVYHVNMGEAAATCDCLGHVHWGYCRHVAFLQAMIREGVA